MFKRISNRVILWDRRVIRAIIDKRRNHLTRFMKTMTRLGDGWLYPVIAIWQLTTIKVELTWFLTGVFSYIVEIVLQLTIKNLSGRRRPFNRFPGIDNLVAPPDQYSFPSGHTAVATLTAIIFSIGYPPITVILVLFALLVGFSRIYLGVHYPTDVLFGILLGIISVLLAWWIAVSIIPILPDSFVHLFPFEIW